MNGGRRYDVRWLWPGWHPLALDDRAAGGAGLHALHFERGESLVSCVVTSCEAISSAAA